MTWENIRQLYAEHGSVELTRATFAGPADQLSADFCQTFAVHPNASIGVQVTIGRTVLVLITISKLRDVGHVLQKPSNNIYNIL